MKAPLLIALAMVFSGPTAGAQKCSRQLTPTAPDSRYELLNQGAEVLITERNWSGNAAPQA